MAFDSIGIVGAGAWGTALGQTMCLAGRPVLIWAREPEVVAEIEASHANTAFLPGVALDPGLAGDRQARPMSPAAMPC